MTEQLDDLDHDALERCIEIAKRDPIMLERIEATDDWIEGAKAAAYSCQCDSLRLRPWQEPPAVASESGIDRDPNAQALLRRMLAAGLSRYEPDPPAARDRDYASAMTLVTDFQKVRHQRHSKRTTGLSKGASPAS